MTFTEAAIEVLRRTGKPLHYKKITELAIQFNLLSHVGKTPEVTMSSRLATLVKKDRGESLIIKVKPGVFGLRDFGQEVIAAAAVEIPDDPHAAMAEEIEIEVDHEDSEGEEGGASIAPPAESLKPAQEPKPKSKPLPGSDVFPEEDDDDEPILGGPDKEKEDGDGESRDGRGRRRRRRRRGGGDDDRASLAPPPGEDAERVPAEPREPRLERGGERGERNRGRGDRPERGERLDRGEPRQAFPRESREEFLRADPNREPADGELAGKDLADAVFLAMSSFDRNAQGLTRISETLVRRGRLQGDPAALVPTVAAAVRADIARREAEGVRPRFRYVLGRVSLTDWALSPEAIRFEQDAVRAADRQRDQVRQMFLRRVKELPGAGFAELLATWLNAEGVVSLRAVRRPGAQPGELHLAGTLKRGHDEVRLAILARRDGREINRERVIEMRGALHHYGSASLAWMITTGPVLSGAREEAAVPGTTPCSLFDGTGLARAMERVGVGLRRHIIPVATLDVDLLDALRGIDPLSREERQQKEREEREQRGEPRGEQREGGRRRSMPPRNEGNEDETNAPSEEPRDEELNEEAPTENGEREAARHHDHEHNQESSEAGEREAPESNDDGRDDSDDEDGADENERGESESDDQDRDAEERGESESDDQDENDEG